MEVEKILKALRRLKVETGSLACLGCGHENSCSTRGCAVIREAIDALERSRWAKEGYKIDIEESAKNILDRIQQKFGISAEQLLELAQAYQEGRCVLNSLKIGDEVYINLFGRVLPFGVMSVAWYGSSPTYKAIHGIHLCYAFKDDDIGKNVFLTREAAEVALKGECKQ